MFSIAWGKLFACIKNIYFKYQAYNLYNDPWVEYLIYLSYFALFCCAEYIHTVL